MAPATDVPLIREGAIHARSPWDLSPIAEVPVTGDADVAAAFDAARNATDGWRALTVRQRAKCLTKVRDAFFAEADRLVDIVVSEAEIGRAHV